MMHRSLIMVLVAMLGLASADLRADVLSPPPKDCPLGTIPSGCHGPPLCWPRPCKSGAECAPGLVCKGQPLCLKQINCGGGYAPKYVNTATGQCPGGAPCKVGTCTTVQVCIPGKPKPDARPPQPDVTKPPKDTALPTPDKKLPAGDTAASDTGSAAPAPARGCSCDISGPWSAALPSGLLLMGLLLRRRRPRD